MLQLQHQYEEVLVINTDLRQQIDTITDDYKQLQVRNETLRSNLSHLHKTAVCELRKRDNEILALRKQLRNFTFTVIYSYSFNI